MNVAAAAQGTAPGEGQRRPRRYRWSRPRSSVRHPRLCLTHGRAVGPTPGRRAVFQQL